MRAYRILILYSCETHDFTHTTDIREIRRRLRADHRSAGALGSEAEGAQGRSVERTKARLWAQDFVSFGYRSQSRETMEYSAKSECDGAFERRRETSPLPPREPNSPVVKQDKYEQDMDQMKTAQGDLAVNMDQMETTQGTSRLWILWI